MSSIIHTRTRLFKDYLGVLILFFILVLNYFSSHYPEITETVYSRGIFIGIRKFYNLIDGLFLIPGILIAIIILIVLPIICKVRSSTKSSKIIQFVLNLISIIIALFYMLWGFNYNRIPFLEQSNIELIDLDSTMIVNELRNTIVELNELRTELKVESTSFDSLLPVLQIEMDGVLNKYAYPTNFNVKIRKWKIKGILLRFSTSGIYIPHALEGNIDGGLHPLQVPIIASHELTHGYGITHEGVSNFLAYKACSQSQNQYIKYSARLNYLKYIAFEVRYRFPQVYETLMKRLSPEVKADRVEIYEQMNKYPDILPQIRDMVYDRYLKSHGVKHGIHSYNLLVQLVLSDRENELKKKENKSFFSD